MKTPLDEARLRLSAVHPEMSEIERDRAVRKISDALAPSLLEGLEMDLRLRIKRAQRDLAHLQLQMEILQQAQYRAGKPR